MKASRKIKPEQFKARQAEKEEFRLAREGRAIRREMAAATALPVDSVGNALERLTDLLKTVNDRLERHNAKWSDKIQQVKEYRDWLASYPGNEKEVAEFDALPTLDKMAMFEYRRMIDDTKPE